MQVLFVKLTSMGDLIHALPAMTDAKRAIPQISFDWVIEKSFSEVAMWHPAVKNIITTSHRRWRKKFWESIRNREIQNFIKNLRQQKYDSVIDGQTSFKSACVMMLSRGERHGLDNLSSREWIAHLAYQKRYFVNKEMHAIKRLRLLFSQVLNYAYVDDQPDYGLHDYPFPKLSIPLPENYLVFVHNASWDTKLWSENDWRNLIAFAGKEGLNVVLPWGNEGEKQRAERIVSGFNHAQVLPFCSLSEQASILKGAKGAICSDTGLSHLAAALNVPAVTMYGPTSTRLIGTTGLYQQHFVSEFPCIECYKHTCNYNSQKHPEPLCLLEIKPEKVWEKFKILIS